MFTVKEWHEFLYECGLVGEGWLYVNRVGGAYIRWRALGVRDADWGEITEEKLSELLSIPQYGMCGVLKIIPEQVRQRITKMLHFVVNEKPNPREWTN